MRTAVLGGTRFIGPAIVEELTSHGHEVLVLHRGPEEPPGLAPCPHVHLDRRDVPSLREALRRFGAQALVHTCAYSRADAEAARSALAPSLRLVVLSSMDVYRAFGALRAGTESDPVPLDEDAPVRSERYLYRAAPAPPLAGVEPDTYEKLDVEEVLSPAGAVVLRLPVVYGAGDPLRREDFILRRVLAGRRRIPFGAGTLLVTKGWVRDVAAAVRLAAECGHAGGAVLNVGEARTWTMQQWARRILAAAGAEAELVPVPDAVLPPDLAHTGSFRQHVLVDSGRARRLLGWTETPPETALGESVRWHLAHPAPGELDFSADDRALARAQ